MGNIVKVSRAPRVRKVELQEVKKGEFFLQGYWPDEYALCEKDSPARWMNTPFNLPYVIELGVNEVIPFESFEAMCKWVAGGRKLEDLQGDAKDEWVAFEDISIGTVFTRINSFDTSFIKTLVDKAVELPTGDYHSFLDGTKVWPLGPGDSITIEPEKP